jgi:hypothetical protein
MSKVNPTLTQELAKRGFTHRAPSNPNHSGRVIVNGCGTAIGRLTSSEGWEWVRLGCPLDVNGFIDADAIANAVLERVLILAEVGQ